MNKTKTITISGGFHNAGEITIRAKIDPRGGILISNGQAKKIRSHMCGVPGCICGMRHGWIINGSDSDELSEAINETDARTFLNSYRNTYRNR